MTPIGKARYDGFWSGYITGFGLAFLMQGHGVFGSICLALAALQLWLSIKFRG